MLRVCFVSLFLRCKIKLTDIQNITIRSGKTMLSQANYFEEVYSESRFILSYREYVEENKRPVNVFINYSLFNCIKKARSRDLAFVT